MENGENKKKDQKAQMTPEGWRIPVDHTRHHRENKWNYCGCGIYHITLVVTDHFPLFGRLEGARPNEAHVQLNKYGQSVLAILRDEPRYYGEKGYALKLLATQIMPDHIHFVIEVLKPLPKPIGTVIRGFKSACTSAYKKELESCRKYAASMKKEGDGEDGCRKYATRMKSEGEENILHFARIFARTESIWESDPAYYHERILHSHEQLQAMIDYVKDNPRRLAIKRANPELFKIKWQTEIGGGRYTTLGNMFLTQNPMKQVLQFSRTMTEEEIKAKEEECLSEAANGTVYVSAAISPGEKQICRAIREAGFPLIVLLEEGFPKEDDPHYQYYKPSGVYFEACAKEQLLLAEPEEALLERAEIEAKVYAKAGEIPHNTKRYRFLALNALAEEIAGA